MFFRVKNVKVGERVDSFNFLEGMKVDGVLEFVADNNIGSDDEWWMLSDFNNTDPTENYVYHISWLEETSANPGTCGNSSYSMIV